MEGFKNKVVVVAGGFSGRSRRGAQLRGAWRQGYEAARLLAMFVVDTRRNEPYDPATN